MAHGGKGVILDIEFVTGFYNEPVDGGIMHMAQPWKQVVLYLEGKTAQEPGDHPIVRSKIGGGIHLENRPLLLYLLALINSFIKMYILHHMGQLKDHCYRKAFYS